MTKPKDDSHHHQNKRRLNKQKLQFASFPPKPDLACMSVCINVCACSRCSNANIFSKINFCRNKKKTQKWFTKAILSLKSSTAVENLFARFNIVSLNSYFSEQSSACIRSFCSQFRNPLNSAFSSFNSVCRLWFSWWMIHCVYALLLLLLFPQNIHNLIIVMMVTRIKDLSVAHQRFKRLHFEYHHMHGCK